MVQSSRSEVHRTKTSAIKSTFLKSLIPLFLLSSTPGVVTAIDCSESRLNSIENINKDCDGEPIPFPTGFGNLLLLPFGLDIEQAKEFGKGLFKRRFMEVYEMSGVTGDGQYRYMPKNRCKKEKRGMHPIGGKGQPWTLAVWNEAQEWCSDPENSCSGIMQFVGNATENCHHWCGTPQFCEDLDQEDDSDGEITESSEDWNLWYRTASFVPR